MDVMDTREDLLTRNLCQSNTLLLIVSDHLLRWIMTVSEH